MTKKRMVKNAIAARIITLGGLTILLMLGAIIWHLLRVVLPLVKAPDIGQSVVWQVPDNHQVLEVGDIGSNQPIWLINECRLVYGYLSKEGSIVVHDKGSIVSGCRESLKIVTHNREQWLFHYDNNNQLFIKKLAISQDGPSNVAIGHHQLVFATSDTSRQQLKNSDWLVKVGDERISLALKANEGWNVFQFNHNGALIEQIEPDRSQGVYIEAEQLILLPEYQQVVGVKDNQMMFFDEKGLLLSKHEFDAQVMTLSASESQRSIFIGTKANKLQKWIVSNDRGQFNYKPSVMFDVRDEIISNLYSPNEQAIIFLTNKHELWFANSVTGEILQRSLLTFNGVVQPEAIDSIGLYNKNLYFASGSTIYSWSIDAHSSVTTKALLSEAWYEGYTQSDYVWQSTPSNSQAEVKFSLTPLIIGSLKSASLAMVIAIPLALGAAIYTAYLSPDVIRNRLKPVIELLEAIPSVVIGFIAAGWMATMTVNTLVVLVFSVLLLPVILWVVALVQHRLSQRLPKRWQRGSEWFVVSVMLVILYLVIETGISWSNQDIALSVTSLWGDTNWNKSTLIVALALGIAIVPTIYSIAEDAIYEVPIHLRQASFALGATQLQTLRKVVLVAALPSIVSAIMLGFSRAFGETILVLMITGNTPIADWDLLVGLRSMTANLAIELPEAEVNSTHYRVLFLSALILFVFTFVVNTLAEWVRGNVRRRYRYA